MNRSHLKVHRAYTLPTWVFEASAEGKLSENVRDAVAAADTNPVTLAEALIARIESGKKVSVETKRTTVNVSMATLDQIDRLTRVTSLPVEQVMKLSLEAHMSKKIEDPSSTKESQ